MQNFLKLDLVDGDDISFSEVQAEDLDSLVRTELSKYCGDDRLEPCFGQQLTQCLTSRVHDDCVSILWSPGDGGEYTVATYSPDTEAHRQRCEKLTSMVS